MTLDRREFLALGAAGAAGVGIAATPEFDDDLVVLMADAHVSFKPDNHYGKDLPKVVDQILAMRPLPRNVIDFGDLSHLHGLVGDYRVAKVQIDRLRQAGITVTLGLGNHDRRGNFYRVFAEEAGKSPVPGYQVRLVELRTVGILMLDSLGSADGEAEQHADERLWPAEQEYLRRFLDARKRPFFVAAHHPIDKLTLGKVPLKDVLAYHRFAAGYIHGHWHSWQSEWFHPDWENRISLHSVGLPSSSCDGDLGIVEMRVGDDRATFTLRQRDFWIPTPVPPGRPVPRQWRQRVLDNMRGGRQTIFFDRQLPGAGHA